MLSRKLPWLASIGLYCSIRFDIAFWMKTGGPLTIGQAEWRFGRSSFQLLINQRSPDQTINDIYFFPQREPFLQTLPFLKQFAKTSPKWNNQKRHKYINLQRCKTLKAYLPIFSLKISTRFLTYYRSSSLCLNSYKNWRAKMFRLLPIYEPPASSRLNENFELTVPFPVDGVCNLMDSVNLK